MNRVVRHRDTRLSGISFPDPGLVDAFEHGIGGEFGGAGAIAVHFPAGPRHPARDGAGPAGIRCGLHILFGHLDRGFHDADLIGHDLGPRHEILRFRHIIGDTAGCRRGGSPAPRLGNGFADRGPELVQPGLEFPGPRGPHLMQGIHGGDVDGLSFPIQIVQILAAHIAEQIFRNPGVVEFAVETIVGEILDTITRGDRFGTLIPIRGGQCLRGGIHIRGTGDHGTERPTHRQGPQIHDHFTERRQTEHLAPPQPTWL
ncbi:hypothetical protein NLM24_07990 [Nocardia zapadnayensis]|nr:hypothetical protein [Nocardia zapadnayensis]